jgi:hypothetical protein
MDHRIDRTERAARFRELTAVLSRLDSRAVESFREAALFEKLLL